jgi:hypothetical protein
LSGASSIVRALAVVVLGALGAGAAGARVLSTVDEALARAFPGAAIERRTVYLTPGQAARVEALAGSPPSSAIVHPYAARRDGELVGTAYFDTHVVRTLAETVMVVVRPDGAAGRVEVIAFDEPPDYLPRDAWYRQFDGRPLDGELDLRGAIRPVSGATLTAVATTGATRRALALHRVLAESAGPAPVAPVAPAMPTAPVASPPAVEREPRP